MFAIEMCLLMVEGILSLFALWVSELGFLNCDEIGMCVVNKQFELLEFVFILIMLT